MRLSVLLIGLAFALGAMLAPLQVAAQEAPRVINVISVDTGGDNDKFLEFVKRATAIQEKYKSTGTTRVFLSTLAGPNANSVVVAVEYPSFVSMAQSNAKVTPTPEWQKFIDDFQAAGMSVRSNSVSVEITP